MDHIPRNVLEFLVKSAEDPHRSAEARERIWRVLEELLDGNEPDLDEFAAFQAQVRPQN